VLDEELNQIRITLFGCQMYRSRPVLALGCHIRAVLDGELGQIHMTPFACQMQWCRPVLRLGCRVRAMLDEAR